MSVLQQYYTSYSNKETGRTGFQIKATSAGIPPNIQGTIARLIAYSVPRTLDIHALDTHPIALRYYYQGKGSCILLCSQSTGNDESGRPGNFFAHTLVLETDNFTAVPPIFYWKSPFWCYQDPVDRTQLDSLPILLSFDEEPSLELEKVWTFIDQGDRRTLLYKLLCAVVYSNKTYRRIIILDTTDNTANWIAAISTLLPPVYRPLLTFATYHHDPHQGHYLITGMTSASAFHPSATDHKSFFILDAYAGTTSEVPDSPYAKMAASNAQPDLYEAQLLSLFVDYTPNPSTDLVIDEQLDELAH